jgi:hypothetical protein
MKAGPDHPDFRRWVPGKEGKYCYLRLWPTPVKVGAETDIRLAGQVPIYGRDVRDWARMVWRLAKQADVNIGPYSTAGLIALTKGERVLLPGEARRLDAYLTRAQDKLYSPPKLALRGKGRIRWENPLPPEPRTPKPRVRVTA